MEAVGGEEELGLGFPFWVPARRTFKPGDPFFAAGDIERELIAKQVALDLTEDERYQLQKMEGGGITNLLCPIVGCGARLNCLEDFEDHYHARHTASCSVCSRVYPTSRLLSVHISEAHDSFFEAKVARGFPMYECLVEGCGVKLKSYKSRQQHLVDKHKFPRSFEFYRKAHSCKHQRQKYQRWQSAYRGEETMETHMDVDRKTLKQPCQKYQPKQVGPEETKETDMEVEEKIDDLVSAVSKLSTSDSTPSCISFGHRRARGFAFVPRSIQQNRKQQSDAKR
ncbi:zinc finger protein 511 [Phoenix dactylifera]|uniref:Zinc finger protein 511 n=1 Tax=Phoenix dactylifera TaxID=42345 RepID=A0A8B7CVF6_PHODC|nr:zinc finger protein 511 [Phoenix dactylifera]XP_008807435.1 zinc finger protein 511 [Phoenix dactylifera]XP_017701370.1 zinc finger protein 511 [Phoenix dactylifera]